MSVHQIRPKLLRRHAAGLVLTLAALLGVALMAPEISAASGTFAEASSDGSKVFTFTNEQLLNNDTDTSQDIYQGAGGTTVRMSQGPVNGNGAFDAVFERASSDGLTVFFSTDEPLVSGDTDTSQDIYQRFGGTALVSQGDINGNGAFGAFFSGASSDGSRVFFYTDEPLVSGDTDTSYDLYERSGGTTTQVSQGDVNGNGAFGAFFSGASSDGSRVFFYTDEPLVSGDTDSSQDIYERSGGATTLVSQGQINGNGAFDAVFERVSSDGSKVFFNTFEKLVSGGVADTDSSRDIYERSAGTTTLVSQGQINGNGAFNASFADASSDGSTVFFNSAEKLGSGDTDSSQDYYQRSGGDHHAGLPRPDQRQRHLPRRRSPRLERRFEGLLHHLREAGQRRHRQLTGHLRALGRDDDPGLPGPDQRQRRPRRRPRRRLKRRLEGLLQHRGVAGHRRHRQRL